VVGFNSMEVKTMSIPAIVYKKEANYNEFKDFLEGYLYKIRSISTEDKEGAIYHTVSGKPVYAHVVVFPDRGEVFLNNSYKEQLPSFEEQLSPIITQLEKHTFYKILYSLYLDTRFYALCVLDNSLVYEHDPEASPYYPVIRIRASLSNKLSFHVETSMYRHLCSNLLYGINSMLSITKRKTKNFSVSDLNILKTVEKLKEIFPFFDKMGLIPINANEINSLAIPEKTKKEIKKQIQKEVRTRTPTVWDYYMASTYILSRSDLSETTQDRIEKELYRVIERSGGLA